MGLRVPRAALAAICLACAASSCQVIEARERNLRELHDESGAHRREAASWSDPEYFVRYNLARLRDWKNPRVGDKKPSKVRDPLATCIANLRALARFPGEDERIHAIKVESFARIARTDPWQMSRRICLRHLAAEGERLELARNPVAEPAGEPATPDALRAALTPLLRALGAELPRELAASPPAAGPADGAAPGAPSDFQAACRAVAALRYDEEGILRALAAGRALLGHVGAAAPERAPLVALVRDLERRTIHMALERALADESRHVRAEAVLCGFRAEGPAFVERVLTRVAAEEDPEVPIAILASVRRGGLPAAAPPPAPGAPADAERERLRVEQLALVYRVATEHEDDRVRMEAMRALGAVSGAGFESLREEDWQAWWHGPQGPAGR